MELHGLNPPQQAAVHYIGGPLVVFAGAGSGKTRVITHRIAYLLTEQGVRPWEILAVTFTNKAAGEMRARLEKLVALNLRGLHIGTFHATCARLLRNYSEVIGIRRDFTIYDDQDQRAMIKRILGDLRLDPKRFLPKAMAGEINRAKQEVISPEQYATEGHPYREIVLQVYRHYEEKMRDAHALDFGDLIYRMVVALETKTELRQELAMRFRHCLVDEFQDTNHAQFRLVKALSNVHNNLCVVGDDDQSIYRWRGADRRNILDFRRTYPRAEIIKLEQNYRSTQRILRVAHAVIRHNQDREPKQMWTENEEGAPIVVVRTQDERDEANQIVLRIKQAELDGRDLENIAVFYRTHAQSRVLEEALRQADIPYRIVGGVRFYDRAEVKDLLAYLKVLHNPADDVALLRIINTPSRGIGKTSIQRLLDVAAEHGVGVWDIVSEIEEHDCFGAAARKKIGIFRELIEKLRREVATLPLGELGGAVLEDTQYVRRLADENTPEADARIGNLEEFVGSMLFYVQEHPEADLAQFLEEITLRQEELGQEEEPKITAKLTLMTIHAAKGLEFDTVFIAGLEEGMFPLHGTDPGEDPEEMEEERRLAYVAFTRARKELILSFADCRRIYGQQRWNDRSRFLLEIPEEDIHWIGDVASRNQGLFRFRPGFADSHASSSVPGESYVDFSEGADIGGLMAGMKVRHPKFGVGEVRKVEMGTIPKASVRFAGGTTKTLAAKFLEPV